MNHIQDIGGKVVSSGIDYLTFSLPEDEPAAHALAETFDAKMMHGDDGQTEPRKTKHGSYEGWQCGQYFHGTLKGRRLFRASGSASPEVLQWILDNRVDARPSRIDLRVDVQRNDDPVGFASELRAMVRAAENRKAAWTPKTLKLYEGKKGDDSIYLNSPEGDHYGVRYHKSKQDRTVILPNVLRDEIRYGDDYAKRIFEKLKQDDDPQQTAIDAATDFYKKFGIDPCYSVPAKEFRLPVLPKVSKDSVFADWFCANIAPRIFKMKDEELRRKMAVACGFKMPDTTEFPETRPWD